MKRAKTAKQVIGQKIEGLPFCGKWLASFGTPELSGSWIVWGDSGNGKTRLALTLAKLLTQHCKVAYNSLEEGISLSMQNALVDLGMAECGNKFILLDKESLEDMKARLKARYAPRVMIVDSFQYTQMNYAAYLKLMEEFPKVLFIFLSHADGKQPAGRSAKSVMYDAFVKVFVKGFVAYPISRYGGGEPFVIWEEGAKKYNENIV